MGLGTILGLGQAAVGIAKGIFNKRPEYKIPKEEQVALGEAALEFADKSMPGEDTMRDQIALTSANALKAASESGSVGESVAAIKSQEDKAMRELGVVSAQDQKGDLINYQQALSRMAAFKDKEFQINQEDPFVDAYQEGRQLVGAAIENISNDSETEWMKMLLKDRSDSAVSTLPTNKSVTSSNDWLGNAMQRAIMKLNG